MSLALEIYMRKRAAEKFNFASVARPGMSRILEKGPIDPLSLAKMRPSPAAILSKTQRPETSEEMQQARMEAFQKAQKENSKGQKPEQQMMMNIMSKLDGMLSKKNEGAYRPTPDELK